ncbi:hypothetical protein PybrP1_012412 [[Pythium] brassicae (nom. inval.)]|nr:hypothetical protein PybrP1_012412 [[Pythium] brassicae (nom. inval.)]
MWFLSLDMASGFWAVPMTERVKLISASICPLGYFQWVRMPFDLKNAPLVYQRIIDNCVWGLVRLPPWLEKGVDPEGMEFFGIDPARYGLKQSAEWQERVRAAVQREGSWSDNCLDLELTLPKSSVGKRAIPYLSHEFIEGLLVLASALYELTDVWVKFGESLDRAKCSFELLKIKIASTPILRPPDRAKPFVVIPHTNPWAISAVLGKEHDGVIFPVHSTGRTLHDPESRYHPAEREILALLRVLSTFHTMIVGQQLKVYTRYSVLKWIFRSNFDSSAKLKTNVGSASFIAWKLPEWVPVHSEGIVLTDVTVNEAEYRGLLAGLDWVRSRGTTGLLVIGDSRLAIGQCQGTMRANKPHLEELLRQYHVLRTNFVHVQLIHVVREFNDAPDYLASKALRLGASFVVDVADEVEVAQLLAFNRLPDHVEPTDDQAKTENADEHQDGPSDQSSPDQTATLDSEPIAVAPSPTRLSYLRHETRPSFQLIQTRTQHPPGPLLDASPGLKPDQELRPKNSQNPEP